MPVNRAPAAFYEPGLRGGCRSYLRIRRSEELLQANDRLRELRVHPLHQRIQTLDQFPAIHH